MEYVLTRKTVTVAVLVTVIFSTSVFYGWRSTSSSIASITFVDDVGKYVVVTKPPKKIVSMSPSITEILFALGLGNKVVGVTWSCDYPPEVIEIEKISYERNYATGQKFGDYMIERIVELNPDLVIMERSLDTWHLYWLSKLQESGLNVVVLWAKSYEDVFHDIELIGKATWSREKAAKLIGEMEWAINLISQKVEKLSEADRPRVFATSWYDGESDPWTFGPGNHKPPYYVDEIIEKAGGINIGGIKSGHFQMDMEAVVMANPQIILVVEDPRYPTPTFDAVLNDEGLKKTEAIQNNEIYRIDMRPMVRPAPRIADSIRETAEILHPELFG